jgi:hypothetical protein
MDEKIFVAGSAIEFCAACRSNRLIDIELQLVLVDSIVPILRITDIACCQ